MALGDNPTIPAHSVAVPPLSRLFRYSMIAIRAGWAIARITWGSLIVIRRESERASVIGP
ncbi:hypothetical protein Misp05_04670 [Micromonospora sp. NBRC 107095]|nr:hypothetical protein Misp05_04670 [Micromonospora sp. NBRC 107095]